MVLLLIMMVFPEPLAPAEFSMAEVAALVPPNLTVIVLLLTEPDALGALAFRNIPRKVLTCSAFEPVLLLMVLCDTLKPYCACS